MALFLRESRAPRSSLRQENTLTKHLGIRGGTSASGVFDDTQVSSELDGSEKNGPARDETIRQATGIVGNDSYCSPARQYLEENLMD